MVVQLCDSYTMIAVVVRICQLFHFLFLELVTELVPLKNPLYIIVSDVEKPSFCFYLCLSVSTFSKGFEVLHESELPSLMVQ